MGKLVKVKDNRMGQTPQKVSKAGLESAVCTHPSTRGPLHRRRHESVAGKEAKNSTLADLTALRNDSRYRGDRKPACRRTPLL